MELEHMTVKELKLLDSVTREQPIEADLSLPEYYPAIERILRGFVCPSEEAVTFADGRVSVAGTAEVRLLYADDANRLHCYRTETKYTKILQTDVRDEHVAVRISQEVRSLSCRALGPKRAEIKANIAVKAELTGIAETSVVSEAGPDWQLRSNNGAYCEPILVCCREFTSSDTVRCEAGGKNLKTVIAATAMPLLEKTEVVSNKIMLRGKNAVSVICADEDGAIGQYDISVPFSEVLDCFGAAEELACNVLFYRTVAQVSLPEEGGNELDVSVRNLVEILASSQQPLTCVTDAYSLRGETECRFTEVAPARTIAQTVEEERISTELEAYEDGGFTVSRVFVSDVSCTATGASGGADGSLCFNAVIADSEGRPVILTKNVTFSHALPEGSRSIGCDISVKNESGEKKGGKILLSCTLVFHLLTQTGENMRLLTELKEGEDGNVPRTERAVVYFAEKGESLWEIAKTNRTSVAKIKAFNELSSDVIETDTRLIFSCF